ncbi:lipopolysaccharide export system protein LptC [Spirochaetota bacterium]|nr:lipopolysaccharide export system protein LptC [Spirochaetota bacterium]
MNLINLSPHFIDFMTRLGSVFKRLTVSNLAKTLAGKTLVAQTLVAKTPITKGHQLKTVILTVLLIASVSIAASCTQFDPNLAPNTDDVSFLEETTDDASITNFQMASYNQSTLKWNMKSVSASIFDIEKRTYLKNVSLTYYDITRRPTSFVASDKAIMETDSQNIELMDNVVIRNTKGTVVSGDYFYWDNTTERLTSPKKVTLRKQDGFSVSGIGFSATKDLEEIVFDSAVSGEVTEQGAKNDNLFDIGF